MFEVLWCDLARASQRMKECWFVLCRGLRKPVIEELSFSPRLSGFIDVHQVERKWSGKGCKTAWDSENCTCQLWWERDDATG